MEKYPFIFSDERNHRIRRHSAFWLFWWLFQGVLYSFVGSNIATAFAIRLPMSMVESAIFMSNHIFLAYSLMYFVIPRFLLKQRYWQTAGWTLFLFFITALLAAVSARFVIEPLRNFMLGDNYVGPPRTYTKTFFLSLLAGLRGGITIGGIAAAIKLMKYWYAKEQLNLQLQKENAEAQLQLLKAQVHPHFLFNTLNNIYSYTQSTSPVASRLVTRLSDLLRFILYEASQPLIPLGKELIMIQDYIALEKIRYGNKLDLDIQLPEKTNNLCIAPLLLLPLIENCFKHGTSNMLEQPWISLHITLQDDQMQMKLLNGKTSLRGEDENSLGIGIQNVEKRLNLLYPEKYELIITNDEEVFIVNLKIKLEQKEEPVIKQIIPLQQSSHA